MKLTKEQRERYSRHILLRGMGEEGQKKLLSGSVLIIGAGGLGSPAAMYLAAAGVGALGIADADMVEISNLQRQIIHGTSKAGVPKALSAKERMEEINPEITIKAYPMMIGKDNIEALVQEYDFILDCTDNFSSKFLINDTCVRLKKPFSHAGIVGYEGQLMTYVPGMGACYRCIFGDEPPAGEVPTCREVGVMGAAVGVIGSLQALEAIKYLTGIGELLTGTLLIFDAFTMNFRRVRLPGQSKDCPVCSAISNNISYH